MSNIEWTDATWSPVFAGDSQKIDGRLNRPLKWRKPRRVFVNSMSDLFHEAVPFEFVDRVFATMALCPRHTFQVLTKRPERMAEYVADHGRLTMVAQAGCDRGRGADTMRFSWPLPNVWLGTSVENQAEADKRIPHLLRCPAAVRFLSVEPLLGPVDLSNALWAMDGTRRHGRLNHLHWVIVGGESGPHARPCNIEWIRSVVRQCKAAGVPCFVKQLGARPVHDVIEADSSGRPTRWREFKFNDRKGGDPSEWPEELRVREWPEVMAS